MVNAIGTTTTTRLYPRGKVDDIEHKTGARIIGMVFENRPGQAPRIIRTLYGKKHD